MSIASRKRIRSAAAGSLALALLAGCGVRGGGPGRRVPSGLSVEFSDAASPVPPELLPRLAAIGVRSVFVPALAIRTEGPGVRLAAVPAPDSKYPLPVYLVVRGTGNFDAYLKAAAGRAGDEIWAAVSNAVSAGRYGDVAGIHLDLRVENSAGEYASALGSIRGRMPKAMTLSAALETRLTEDQLKKWRAVGRQVDFLVPVVYGRSGAPGTQGDRVSGQMAQAVGMVHAVIPEYCPQGWGLLQPKGGPGRPADDSAINDLSEDRRFDFEFGSLLSDADENVYVFRNRQPAPRVAWGPGSFEPGDTVTFWENRLSDFTQSLSDPLASRGKIVRLRSLEDGDSLIGFSAVEDILLGRKLEPKLAFSRSAGGDEMTFLVVNSSQEYSELSRLNNWVDLRMDGGRLLDIRPGDFDRFEFLDAGGKPSVAARARTIRFFENFVAPGESMTAGPIRYSGEASFYASAHLTLPDGRALEIAESPVAAVPGDAPPPSAEKPGRRPKSAPRR